MDLMEEMIEQLQADREEEEQPTAAAQPKERQVIQPLHDLSLSSLGGYIIMCVFRFAVFAKWLNCIFAGLALESGWLLPRS